MRAIFTLVFLCMVSSLDGRYRCDYTHFPTADGWLKLHRIPALWQDARLRCHLEGGILLSPLNSGLKQAMQSLIAQKVGKKCAVFTGIHATFSGGDFFSIEGTPMQEIPYTWAVNEPDNYNNSENCIAMLADGNLADVNCDEPYPYICYKKAPVFVQLNNCGTSDIEYTLDTRTGSCYKFHRVPRSWSRAYMACAAEGGYLAIVNNETESTVLRELFAKNPHAQMLGNFNKESAFVGFHDWGEHGEWLTIDGRTLTNAGFDKFAAGQPNNGTTGEFCGAISRNGLFEDLLCEAKFAFICEKRPDDTSCVTDEQ